MPFDRPRPQYVPASQPRQGALTYRVHVAVPDTLPLAVPNRSADLPPTHAPAGSAFDHSYRRYCARFRLPAGASFCVLRSANGSGNLCDVSPSADGIEYRPMIASDVGSVPIVHQGEDSEVLARVAELGSSALLAFDRGRHVGQLQFRRYEPGTRSPHGVWDPLYWMDFVGRAPDVPFATVSVCCCHVGQLDDTERRARQYLGRGIGSALLDGFLAWARQREFAAVIAKATPARRSVMEFLGGFPAPVYEGRGFKIAHTWRDADLARAVRDRGLAGEHDIEASTVACCVLRFR